MGLGIIPPLVFAGKVGLIQSGTVIARPIEGAGVLAAGKGGRTKVFGTDIARPSDGAGAALGVEFFSTVLAGTITFLGGAGITTGGRLITCACAILSSPGFTEGFLFGGV